MSRLMARGVAVIGGGLSGLSCASSLAKQGMPTTVFDMGFHGPGGRASTRRVEFQHEFDMGCQTFSAQSEEFRSIVDGWIDAGFVQKWHGRFGRFWSENGNFESRNGNQLKIGTCVFPDSSPLYVGTSAMDSICDHLSIAENMTTAWKTKVKQAIRDKGSGKWVLSGEQDGNKMELGEYSAIVVADSMVARKGSPGFVDMGDGMLEETFDKISAVKYDPRFVLLATFPAPLSTNIPFEGAQIVDSDKIEWIACNSSKPGRHASDNQSTWVAITSSSYSRELLTKSPTKVAGQPAPPSSEFLSNLSKQLLTDFENTVHKVLPGGGFPSAPLFLAAKRWGSAFPLNPLGVQYLVDSELRFGACGDFCSGPGVEQVVLSGIGMADTVRKMLNA